ncbi:amidase family protein [Mycoplasmopsis verecunda]|uniref:Aspartyl-tRNA(Asn)/glutamyl-tRNA(Gln) amidotransferase subunit A n=1 Tax=Mycoplasmopsis verecunda TaxID=171291 RepID=A0A1T4KR06_9BACT|nr:amidase family protein [Mycoplasmopsis verecunda]WPB54694.1 amidase family protein [Mycoplasmopsis verecunda]SJZ44813.1 aspartyl-tRNA(Asn)/glutamyl-tRNA(Gln) amidotransferase subunit A [Mycoplasmopsis verecunda]
MRTFKQKGNYEFAYNEIANDNNNAVAYLYPKSFYETKNKTLDNVVITIKDVFATKDAPTRASSLILEGFLPSYNATSVQKLLDANVRVVAKVNNDELALGGTGTFSSYGLITNPKDSSRYVGGSSSGSAATMSANIGFALGSDTGDSVRLPASFNGLVGFKPSYGAISRYGMFAYSSSLDTVAFFTHNVNDAIIAAQVMYGVDNKDMTSVPVDIHQPEKQKPKKVGYLDFSQFLKPYMQDSMNQFIKKMLLEGIEVETITPDLDILNTINIVYRVISFSEASSNLANLTGVGFGNRVEANSWEEIMLNTRSQKFGKMVQERLALGSYFLYTENQEEIFVKAQKMRRVIKEYMQSLHDKYDCLILPAYSGIAPKFSDDTTSNGIMNFILTGANLTGNPSITIPLDTYENMPYSFALETSLYNDEKLLGYAEYLEELRGKING